MTSDIPRRQAAGAGAALDSRGVRRGVRAGRERRRAPVLDVLESRRLLSGGGSGPQGVATGAGLDTSIWFTLSSNSIGMINPSNPTAGVTQYAIPTASSGPGPIAAGPQPLLYASDAAKNQIYKIDKTTGTLVQTIPVGKAQDSLIFDSHNDLIYTLGYSVPGVGQVRRVDPTVGISSDTLLATIGKNPGDLVLVPGGHFVLALGRTDGKIYKVDLDHPGQTPTTFGSGQYSGGIVYDSSGRLFAVTKTGVVELDPSTFAVMASSAAMSQLDGLAFDPFTGNLFASSHAADGVSGQQGVYVLSLQPGHFLQATLITSNALPPNFLPDGLEPDGEGNLYVASFQDKIYRIDLTTGTMTALTNPLTGLDDLVPLAGSSGHSVPDYWFFEETADRFGAIDPTTGHITELPPLGTANTQVDGITAGPGGTVWFTEFNTNRIGMIDTDTDAITEFPLPTPGAHPYGIAEGPDGTIWFTESGANQIGKINPKTHAIQEFPIDSSGNGQAEGITIGPDSNLWFTLAGTNKIGVMNSTTGAMIGEYSVPTANAGLGPIVSDPADGNLWFTEQAADKVGRIDPATVAIDEFAVPTAGAAPQAIAVSGNGDLWIAESNGGRIAELSPSNPSHIVEIATTNAATISTAATSTSTPFSTASQTIPLGATVTSSAGTVNEGTETFTILNGTMVIGSAVTVDVVNGTASASYVLPAGTPTGTYTIQAVYNGTTNFGVSSDRTHTLTVTESPPAKLVIQAGPPATATAGQPFATASRPVVVYEEDQSGNLLTGDNSTVVTVGLGSGTGPMSGTLTVTVVGGVATFTDLVDDTAETIGLTFSSGNLMTSAPSDIVISPAAPAKLVVQAQPSPSATAGQPFAIQPVIVEEDQYGNLEIGDDTSIVTASLTSGPGRLRGTTTATVKGGVATFTDLAEDTAGIIYLEFASGGLAPVTASAVTVSPAPATHLVVTTPPPNSLSAGQPFTMVVTAEDPYGGTDTSFADNVTISLANDPGFTTTVQAQDGIATFTGLTVDAAAEGEPIQAAASGLGTASTAPLNVTGPSNPGPTIGSSNPPPTITDEQVVMLRKTNKKGKPVGKAVLQGFTLNFSTAMNAQAAGSAANYTIAAASTRHIKKKKVTVFTPVAFTSSYHASTHSVTLTLSGKQTFATGGQITVVYSPPNGVSSAAGVALDPSDTTFTIQPKAKGITPG